jgi:DNA-binding IclR family transcriptional regulator
MEVRPPPHALVGRASCPEPPQEGRASLAVVRRVLRLLEAVSHPDAPASAKQLATQLGISRSTAYTLLALLAAEGYIQKLPGGAGYRLGPAVSVLGERMREQAASKHVARIVHRLAQQVGRSAHVAVLVNGEAELVAAASPPYAPPVGLSAGFRGGTHALAVGKVLLAGGGLQSTGRYISSFELESFTPQTITDPATLELHLREVRSCGFATDAEEFSLNLCSIAVPLAGPGGDAGAALGVSTTASRFASDRRFLLDALRRIAATAG